MRVVKRLLKWFLFFILGLLFLLTIAFGTAYYYKSDILAAVNDAIRKSTNGEAGLRDITFSFWDKVPGLSITLHDIYLRGPQYDLYKKNFLVAGKVYVNVRLAPLFKKTIVVRSVRVTDGEIDIFRTRSGYINTDVFRTSGQRDTVKVKDPLLVFIHNIQFENVRLSFRDSLKGKSFGIHFRDVKGEISETDSSRLIALNGPLVFGGLMFNSEKGSYLKEKAAKVRWNLELRPGTQRLIIYPSAMEFEKSVVQLSGNFSFGIPGNFQLGVNSDRLDYGEGVSLLTEALQSKLNKFQIEQPVRLNVQVAGQLAPGVEPAVDIGFRFVESNVKAMAAAAEKVTAEGSFSNHVNPALPFDDHNSVVNFTQFDASYRGFPLHASGTLHDLKEPQVDMQLNVEEPLKSFRLPVDSSMVLFKGGTFKSTVAYSGKLKELMDSTATSYEGKLSGKVVIKDGAFEYVPGKQNYEKVNVKIGFDKTRLTIEEMSLMVNKSTIDVRGDVVNYIPFFIQPKTKGLVKLQVHSPYLDLASIIHKTPATIKIKKGPRKKAITLIGALHEKLEFELSLQLDQLVHENMKGSAVKGTLSLKDNNLKAKDFAMNLAGGRIAFSFTLANLQMESSPFYLKASVRGADVKKFFYSFNDFGLKAITYKNLEGKVDLDTRSWAWVHSDRGLQMGTIGSDINFSIKKGRLIDFEPLQKMSNFLFKKRDFTDIRFGEIKSHLAVRGSEIDISKMEIESTVLRLFVEGRYSLKDKTDLSIQVPLSNLKKRDKDYKPENVGVDSKVGPSVYLHVYTENGKTAIAYDPFKKHVKKQDKGQASE